MRFGIRKKLMLLTALLSLALIAASVFVSSRLYSARLDREKAQSCLDSANGIKERISEEYFDFLRKYRQKIEPVYFENRQELESIEQLSPFESFDEKEKYYSELTKGIFPPKDGFGLSYEMAIFNNNYTGLLQELDLLAYTDGLDSGTIYFYDAKHENMVFLMDIASEQSLNYHFPTSIVKPWDQRLKIAHEQYEPTVFFSRADCYSIAPIIGDDSDEPTAFVCYGSYNADSTRSTSIFMAYTSGIMLAATAVIAMFVMLFADKLIVRNIKKLSAASEKFTSEIGGGKPEKVSAAIISSDEIGSLSEKFDLMQDSILGYIDSLAEKTAREEKMNAELELAARIQLESLPKESMSAGRFTINSFLKPAREVGGDLYDYFTLDDGRMFFCLADVSGKGVPAALFMMRAKELIKSGIRAGKPLGEFAYELNNRLCEGNSESVFITAFFGILDTVSGRLKYLRAGHEQPMLKRGSEVLKVGEESNYVLGVFESSEFIADEIDLYAGDVLLMFTDGLNEGINESAEEFGYERIADVLKNADSDITGSLFAALKSFCGDAEQFDDVTMLALSADSGLRIELSSPCYDDITRVTDEVLAVLKAQEGRFNADRISEAGIIIDEVMNNQISYAFEGVSLPKSSVALNIRGERAELVFEDNGKRFDPLFEVTEDAIELSEGGFGIELVKTLSDEQRYEYAEGLNRLTIIKNML